MHAYQFTNKKLHVNHKNQYIGRKPPIQSKLVLHNFGDQNTLLLDVPSKFFGYI